MVHIGQKNRVEEKQNERSKQRYNIKCFVLMETILIGLIYCAMHIPLEMNYEQLLEYTARSPTNLDI